MEPRSQILGGILHVAPGVLNFALRLLQSAMSLRLFVPSPFAYLAFNASSYVFRLAFNRIFIHGILRKVISLLLENGSVL